MKSMDRGVLYAGLAVMSWSTVATAFKIALTYLSNFEMLLVASTTALAIFTLVISLQHKWPVVKDLFRSKGRYYALIGLMNPAAYYLILFKAYDLLPAQIAQPINYIWPILLLLLLALFTHQPIPLPKYIGMSISLGGVVLITAGSSLSGMTLSVAGVVMALSSALLWATYWMLNNRQKSTDPVAALFLGFLFGTAYLVVGALFVGVNLNTLAGVAAGIYIGCFEMALPFLFFSLAMRRTSNPTLINQLCYLAPFFSLFIISKVLGEHIAPSTYGGLFLIIGGILFNQYLAGRKLHWPFVLMHRH